MKTSQEAIELIKYFEGLRLQVYLCPAGVKTVGWGHTGKEVDAMNVGDSITQEQANQFLYKDIENTEKLVDKYSGYNFNDNEYGALVSFAFNIGQIDQLTDNGTRTKQQISNKIPEYCYISGKKSDGLKNRRLKEKELFDRGC